MATALQDSLLDFGGEERPPALGDLAGVRRTRLAHGAWVDHLPGWVSGSGAVLDALVARVPWRAERRRMYDRVVDVPRLVAHATASDLAALTERPDGAGLRVVATAMGALSRHYASELGEPFTTAGFCWYRDGRDSVAWHGDTVGRGATHDTMVAIVSFGAARALCLRPRGGGAAVRFALGHGDLLVMGGSCQRTWQHAVPKSSAAVGPRVSVQFRPAGVL